MRTVQCSTRCVVGRLAEVRYYRREYRILSSFTAQYSLRFKTLSVNERQIKLEKGDLIREVGPVSMRLSLRKLGGKSQFRRRGRRCDLSCRIGRDDRVCARKIIIEFERPDARVPSAHILDKEAGEVIRSVITSPMGAHLMIEDSDTIKARRRIREDPACRR